MRMQYSVPPNAVGNTSGVMINSIQRSTGARST